MVCRYLSSFCWFLDVFGILMFFLQCPCIACDDFYMGFTGIWVLTLWHFRKIVLGLDLCTCCVLWLCMSTQFSFGSYCSPFCRKVFDGWAEMTLLRR